MANSGKLLKANVNTKKGLLNDTFLDILLEDGEQLCINVRLICDIINKSIEYYFLNFFWPKNHLNC